MRRSRDTDTFCKFDPRRETDTVRSCICWWFLTTFGIGLTQHPDCYELVTVPLRFSSVRMSASMGWLGGLNWFTMSTPSRPTGCSSASSPSPRTMASGCHSGGWSTPTTSPSSVIVAAPAPTAAAREASPRGPSRPHNRPPRPPTPPRFRRHRRGLRRLLSRPAKRPTPIRARRTRSPNRGRRCGGAVPRGRANRDGPSRTASWRPCPRDTTPTVPRWQRTTAGCGAPPCTTLRPSPGRTSVRPRSLSGRFLPSPGGSRARPCPR